MHCPASHYLAYAHDLRTWHAYPNFFHLGNIIFLSCLKKQLVVTSPKPSGIDGGVDSSEAQRDAGAYAANEVIRG
jgi:hypothetical protein